jgi:hypothetical protein
VATGNENVVQTAIHSALEVHCDRQRLGRLKLFTPYPNQQGPAMRSYCADLVGMLGSAKIIMLEVKELDVPSRTLRGFRQVQHESALIFERAGVPIAYAYNREWPLAHNSPVADDDWPRLTLGKVLRSVPSALPGAQPQMDAHASLLDWLEDDTGASAYSILGQVDGAIRSARDMTNAMMVLLHGVDQGKLARLSTTQLNNVVNYLRGSRHLMTDQLAHLELIIDASADAFKMFSPAMQSARRASRTSGRSR